MTMSDASLVTFGARPPHRGADVRFLERGRIGAPFAGDGHDVPINGAALAGVRRHASRLGIERSQARV